MTKSVMLDGRLLVRGPSGVGDVAAGLHTGLVELDRSGEIRLQVAVDQRTSDLEATLLPARGFMHWHLPRVAKKTKTDLIVVPRQTRPVISAVPVRPVIHDVGFLSMPEEYLNARAITLSTKYALRRSHVAVVSDFTLQELRTQGFHGGASVLPIQAVHQVERRDRDGAPFLLTVGVQNRHKNLARLVQAWDRADTGDFELWICARRGNAAQEFEEALELSTKRKSVRVVGGLSQNEYLSMLGECHAYVQPSLYEGLGIPLLDVAAAGIPVIGSELGNTGSVLKTSAIGLTFDPLDPAEMAGAIEKVLHDATYREAASQWLAQNIAMTDWRAVARAAIG